MIRLLSLCSADTFFANAGQALVERALVQALPASGKVQIRLLVHGDSAGQMRVATFCREVDSEGAIEVIPASHIETRDVLADISGVMVHMLPVDFWDWFQSHKLVSRFPVIQHIHSLMLVDFELSYWGMFWANWNGWPPARLVAPSATTALRAQALGHLPPVEVVPHGVEREVFHNGDRQKGRYYLGVDQHTPLILSLNRISPNKSDYRQLLLAFAYLLESRRIARDACLALVGGVAPDDRAYVQGLHTLVAQLKIARNVLIIEHLDEGMKPHIMAASDVFISLASNPQESFGVVLLEALAAGLPIVATEWDGYPEVLSPYYRRFIIPTIASHTVARFVDWSQLTDACAPSFDALVARLEHLLNDRQLRRELGAWGQNYVAGYNWSATAKCMITYWEHLIERFHQGNPEVYHRDDAQWSPKSPVDGLASNYLDPSSRLCTGMTVGSRSLAIIARQRQVVADKKLFWHLIDLCQVRGTEGISLASLRASSGVLQGACDRLVLQLLRYGALRVMDV